MEELTKIAWIFCIIAIVILAVISYLIKNIKLKEKRNPQYKKKYLLTKNELEFYKKLKEFADNNNLQILSKIRLADIVEPKQNKNRSEWYSDFGKIKAKHIDFALCNKDNLYILCLIELDDNSHNTKERKERDKFVDEIFESVKIPIVHTKYYNQNTENQLCSILGIITEQVSENGQVPSSNIN